jgi:glycosyltransferase involved in cell wall biosynthesis
VSGVAGSAVSLTRVRDAGGSRGAADVVYAFSYVTWEGAQARGMCHSEDRLVQTLLEHQAVGRLLVCDPFRSLPIKAARRLASPSGAPPLPGGESAAHVAPVRLRRVDPAGLAAVERSCAAYERWIRRAAERHGHRRPAVVTAHPLLAGFGRFEWARSVTFYAIDDWTAYPPHRRWWPAYRAALERMRSSGRRVCAVSDAVMAGVAPTGPSAVVPNGVDPAEWASPGDAPRWFGGLGSPRLLYVGSLDERLDVAALGAVADASPHGSLTLVGPLLAPRHIEALRRRPNVVVRAPVGRDEVVALVAAADACLIPHLRTPLTEGMSPLKLYEYLAGGRPVAATNLAGIAGVEHPRVVLADEHHGLVAAVERALAIGPASETERLRFVAANTWRSRHERILGLALGPDHEQDTSEVL